MAVRKVEPTKKVKIQIIEHDSWSGPSVLETMEADSYEEAKQFCSEYNEKSCPPLKRGESVPGCYLTAEIC